jgi:hypothetical protein
MVLHSASTCACYVAAFSFFENVLWLFLMPRTAMRCVQDAVVVCACLLVELACPCSSVLPLRVEGTSQRPRWGGRYAAT